MPSSEASLPMVRKPAAGCRSIVTTRRDWPGNWARTSPWWIPVHTITPRPGMPGSAFSSRCFDGVARPRTASLEGRGGDPRLLRHKARHCPRDRQRHGLRRRVRVSLSGCRKQGLRMARLLGPLQRRKVREVALVFLAAEKQNAAVDIGRLEFLVELGHLVGIDHHRSEATAAEGRNFA